MAKRINVGQIGYKFMGKAHSHAYRDVAMFFDCDALPVMKAVCGRDEAWVKEAAERFGWEGYETDWHHLIGREDIDLVDINSPSDTHKEIVLAAAAAGKAIYCEKPLALTLEDAREMLAAVNQAKVKNAVGFNVRFAPAVQLAKQLVTEGRLGQIFRWRAAFLQDWIIDPLFPKVWRLDKKVCGSGSLGDLGAHCIDLARFLVGEIDEVIGMEETFVKERPLPGRMIGLSATGGDSSELSPVEVDDATLFMARFANGALGSFEATRFAAGYKDANIFEISGSRGSVRYNFERMNELEYFNREDPADVQGFRTILVSEPVHKYLNAWWPPGHMIGFEHTFIHQVYEILQAMANDTPFSPDFLDGVRCQEVLTAVERSIADRRWVKISEV